MALHQSMKRMHLLCGKCYRSSTTKLIQTQHQKHNQVIFVFGVKNIGHWANECPEGHELEWLANQNCFLCGKKGHLNEACPNKIKKDDHFKTKLEENKPPAVKPSWYQNSTSLIKLLGNLSVKSTSDFKCYKSLSSKTSNHSDPTFYKQKTAEWFNVRKGENQWKQSSNSSSLVWEKGNE